jgi:hypothetical protein
MTGADFPDSYYEMAATRKIQHFSGYACNFDRVTWNPRYPADLRAKLRKSVDQDDFNHPF